MTLILSVATGVGIFLVMAFLRMLLGIPLPRLLVIFYAAIFLLAAFVPKEFLAVAFDSGGVTTGPMTVPFIMALGVGVSAIRSDRHAADDSFGLVALCSVGPILAVLILGIVFNASESSYVPPVIPEVGDSVELWQLFSEGLPTYLHEIATSLLPIVVMFGIFQLAALHIDRRTLGRIGVGLVYTYIGLVLFLAGANIGFMPAGNYLGQVLGGQSSRWLLIPIGMLIGYFIVRAEPLCPQQTGRRSHRRRHLRRDDGRGPLGRRRPLGGPCDGARPHRHLDSVVPHPGLPLRHQHLLCGAEALHRHRL